MEGTTDGVAKEAEREQLAGHGNGATVSVQQCRATLHCNFNLYLPVRIVAD